MADDNKKTNNVCAKVTDRMLVDLGRVCAVEDCSQSDFMYRLLRRELYGRSMQTLEIQERLTSAGDSS